MEKERKNALEMEKEKKETLEKSPEKACRRALSRSINAMQGFPCILLILLFCYSV